MRKAVGLLALVLLPTVSAGGSPPVRRWVKGRLEPPPSDIREVVPERAIRVLRDLRGGTACALRPAVNELGVPVLLPGPGEVSRSVPIADDDLRSLPDLLLDLASYRFEIHKCEPRWTLRLDLRSSTDSVSFGLDESCGYYFWKNVDGTWGGSLRTDRIPRGLLPANRDALFPPSPDDRNLRPEDTDTERTPRRPD